MSRRRRILNHLTRGLGLVAMVTVVVVLGTNAWVRAAARDHGRNEIAALPNEPIVIVPGSPTSSGKVKASLLGRLEGALALYRTRHARAILVSGIDGALDPETTAMRSWLEARGVPARDILSDDRGTRTRQTMLRASRIFGIERAIVCTEALHMPRALFLAEQNGIDAVGYELASPLSRHPRFVVVEALKTTLAVVEEALAYAAPAADTTARTAAR